MQGYIADISLLSTDAWRGRISTVVYLAGCDFRCPGCTKTGIVDFKPEFLRDLRQVKKDLKDSSKFSSAVVFSGGEPCLQKEVLFSLAKHCRTLGRKIGIRTNGSRPDVLRKILDSGLADFISLEIKSPFEPEAFGKATKSTTFFAKTGDVMSRVRQSVELLKMYKRKDPMLEIEFRTTIVPGVIYKKEHVQGIASLLEDIDCSYRLTRFRPELAKGSLSKVNPPSEDFIVMLKDSIEKKRQVRVTL
jgi:pyruvate formate lyase activating enzyme